MVKTPMNTTDAITIEFAQRSTYKAYSKRVPFIYGSLSISTEPSHDLRRHTMVVVVFSEIVHSEIYSPPSDEISS